MARADRNGSQPGPGSRVALAVAAPRGVCRPVRGHAGGVRGQRGQCGRCLRPCHHAGPRPCRCGHSGFLGRSSRASRYALGVAVLSGVAGARLSDGIGSAGGAGGGGAAAAGGQVPAGWLADRVAGAAARPAVRRPLAVGGCLVARGLAVGPCAAAGAARGVLRGGGPPSAAGAVVDVGSDPGPLVASGSRGPPRARSPLPWAPSRSPPSRSRWTPWVRGGVPSGPWPTRPS
jgi:hypothetical protein